MNHEVFSNILDTGAFFLVTLDLYGKDKLRKLSASLKASRQSQSSSVQFWKAYGDDIIDWDGKDRTDTYGKRWRKTQALLMKIAAIAIVPGVLTFLLGWPFGVYVEPMPTAGIPYAMNVVMLVFAAAFFISLFLAVFLEMLSGVISVIIATHRSVAGRSSKEQDERPTYLSDVGAYLIVMVITLPLLLFMFDQGHPNSFLSNVAIIGSMFVVLGFLVIFFVPLTQWIFIVLASVASGVAQFSYKRFGMEGVMLIGGTLAFLLARAVNIWATWGAG